jgi:nucleoside-diphosphate-sugar epimerase
MNIAIIGTAGFLGQILAKYLIDNGHRVAGIDIAKPPTEAAGLSYYKLDILRDEIDCLSNVDVVFYLAQSPFYRDFPVNSDHLFGVNVFGAIKAARAALEQKVRLFCFASSGNVYAPSFRSLSEDHAVRRDNAYSLSKVFAEEALNLFREKMLVVTTRFFGIFGPGQTSMLPVMILNAINSGKPIYLQPSAVDDNDRDGVKISFSYSLDVVKCLLRLAELGIDGAPLPYKLNIAGPEAVSIRTYADTVGRIIGIKPQFLHSPETREFDLIADISLLRSFLRVDFTPFGKAMVATYRPGQ